MSISLTNTGGQDEGDRLQAALQIQVDSRRTTSMLGLCWSSECFGLLYRPVIVHYHTGNMALLWNQKREFHKLLLFSQHFKTFSVTMQYLFLYFAYYHLKLVKSDVSHQKSTKWTLNCKPIEALIQCHQVPFPLTIKTILSINN